MQLLVPYFPTDIKMISDCVGVYEKTILYNKAQVAFTEYDPRVRKGHADENFVIVRHIALDKLKNKRSIKVKRKKNEMGQWLFV